MVRRLDTIAALQSYGIFLVVLGHSLPLDNVTGHRPLAADWLYQIIYSFHMPLFIFISGFLFVYTNRERTVRYSRFIQKKMTRLLLPYFVITTIAFLIKSRLSQYAIRPVAPSFDYYLKGLLFPQYNPIIFFWFLPTIFILLSIAPLLKRVIQFNTAASFTLLLLLAILSVKDVVRFDFFCISCAASNLVYFYGGCLVAHYFSEKIYLLGNYYIAGGAFAALILCTVFPEGYWKANGLFPAIFGIVFSLSFAHLVKSAKLLSPLSGHSYQIYLLSWFPQVFFQILHQLDLIGYVFAVLAMLVGGLAVPLLTVRLIQQRLNRLGPVLGLP